MQKSTQTKHVIAPPAWERKGGGAGLIDTPSFFSETHVAGVTVLHVFTATLFLSALLLFLVQPMVGKMILPLLGGTPAVWNTCMVFFQAALLAGYGYAHLTTRFMGVRGQTLMHLAVLLSAAVSLPIVVSQGSLPPTTTNPLWWLLGRLVVAVGLPFFAVAASAPLFQKWFACTGHKDARDPYFLYAASNFGSLLALLGYPLIVEPALGLQSQSLVWGFGFGLLVVMVVACTVLTWRHSTHRRTGLPASIDSTTYVSDENNSPVTPTWQRRLFWVFAAFIPSSLMLGVTTYVTTDVAPVPLLWVLPLALYLLTFVLVFARRSVVKDEWMSRMLPWCAVLYVVAERMSGTPVRVVFHFGLFFIAAMVCHGALAKSRPTTRHLTEFYLWMSVGGVLGGLFNAIVAPLVFTSVLEYPLALVLACLLRPLARRVQGAAWFRWSDITLPAGLACLLGALLLALYVLNTNSMLLKLTLIPFVPAAVCLAFRTRPIRFALGLGVLIAGQLVFLKFDIGRPLHASRNFFGVKRVVLVSHGDFRMLLHGRTSHGLQSTDPARAAEPLAYFHREGPIGDVFTAFSGPNAKARVAVIGLGTGSMAAYAEPHQHFTFYEIDPEIEQIAHDTRYFTFLDQCRSPYDIVLGDGRLTIAEAPDEHYGMIVMDAFSSDAIPVHLLTREAIQLYFNKLEPDGLLVLNISNNYFRLEPLLGSLAADADLVCVSRADLKVPREEMWTTGRTRSWYAVMARETQHIGALAENPNWAPVSRDSDTPAWTDRYSNILSVLKR